MYVHVGGVTYLERAALCQGLLALVLDKHAHGLELSAEKFCVLCHVETKGVRWRRVYPACMLFEACL